ncbi:hypothetical protein [Ligilactobacillus sp. WC1T17]|uniref:hypothetical protein n=1 Tax=Ligilactobacillus sp. WC1T17 TaxID=3158786 RepID=UPI001CDAEBD7
MSAKLKIITSNFILIAFMMGSNEFMVVGNLSLIAKTFHESLGQMALLVSLYAWSYALVTPVITVLTNCFDRFKLLMSLMFIFFWGP